MTTFVMLPYLSTNTRPDMIAFAVSQVASFSSNLKMSHITGIKTILQYLLHMRDKEKVVNPTGTLNLECYVDAYVSGLHKSESEANPKQCKVAHWIYHHNWGCSHLLEV
jgi:hypothetical protein